MHQRLTATGVIAIALSWSYSVLAEQAAIDEVSVIATRRPTNVSDVSSALAIISKETVLANKLVTDALDFSPGTSLQQTTPGQGAVIIRGLKGSSVLHLVDGMNLNNAIFRSAPTPYLAYVPTTAVERIEVIRGTSTSLYGSGAVGGVVRVVSRLPSFDSSENSIRRDLILALDSANLEKSVRGSVDVGNKNLAASLSGEYLATGNRRTGRGARIAPSGYTSKAARFVVMANQTAGRSWLMDIQLLEQPDTPRVDELVPGFGQTQPSSSEFMFSPSRRLFAHGQYANNFGPLGLNWKFDAAWQRIVDDRTSRDFGSDIRIRESNRSDLLGVAANAAGQSRFGSWIVGTELYRDDVSSSRWAEDIVIGSTLSVQARFPDRSTVDQFALYGNSNWLISDRHRINTGLRFSKIDIHVPATATTLAANLDIDRISGDAGWIFDLANNWQIVANLGFGFRAPNIFDLGTLGNRPGNRFNIPNTDLDVEKVKHVDLGVRQTSSRWQLDVTLFSLRYENRISAVLTGDITTDGRDIVQSVNAARTDIRGIELGASASVTQFITLNAVATATWGRQRLEDVTEEPADRIPPLSARLNIIVDTGGPWTFEGWFASSTEQERLSDRDRRDVRIDPLGTSGWAIAGMRAVWQAPNDWRIAFGLTNLLDKAYRVHGSGIDATGRNLSISLRRVW